MSAAPLREHPERLPWYLVAVTAVVLVSLVIASAANYLSVADAHGRASLVFSSSVSYAGTASDGALLPSGNVTVTLRLTAINPSSRALRLNTVIFKAWIEDLQGETLNPPCKSRQEIAVTNGSKVQCFYRAFSGSQELDSPVVPAQGQATLTYPLVLTTESDGVAFQVVQNITQYAAGTGHLVADLAWNAWVLVSFDILGVPAPSSASAASYLLTIDRILFQGGQDLDAGG